MVIIIESDEPLTIHQLLKVAKDVNVCRVENNYYCRRGKNVNRRGKSK